MNVSIIDQAYNAGAEFSQKGILTTDVINDFRTDYFHKFCYQIRSVIEKRVQEEKDLFDIIPHFRESHLNEIVHNTIDNALLDNNISPSSSASDVELSLQISFIKGYLEHRQISDKKTYSFDLNIRGGDQRISCWINSLMHNYPLEDILHQCLGLSSSFLLHAIFTSQNSDLAEDGWVTMNHNGKWCRFEIKDESYFGDKIVIGGSYEFVQHFADSSTHEAHHLIPQKLLKITGILRVSEGPSIRMKKEDHELTRSYKRGYMLRDDFFRKQLEFLKDLNIRSAVEMEIAEIKAKFGSKYDEAIREVREYVTKLEKQLKNQNGDINEKTNS